MYIYACIYGICCLAMLHFTISISCFFIIKSISFKFLINHKQVFQKAAVFTFGNNQIRTVFHKSYSYQDGRGK